MPMLGYALPILPGKLEHWRRFCQELLGIYQEEYRASRERLGITREYAWLQATPEGEMVIYYLEGVSPGQLFGVLANSSQPFDRWLLEQLAELHGFEPGCPDFEATHNELVFEWQTATGSQLKA
ncbi:MAG TPA: hypothetical protein VH186_03115 [Chloroflexia bacterium]|nr:hypothetical protein [Chloroflexia bacterium]